MGHVRIRVEIVNPTQRSRSVVVESALVDTGATRTTIPRAIADELGLEILGSMDVDTAAGPVRIDQSYAMVRLDGRQSVSDIWVSDAYEGVLIGVVTLEALGLAVDPVHERLIPAPQLLL
jgi:predicted aspartyl protease